VLKPAVGILKHDASYDTAANGWAFKFELVHTPLDEFLHETQVTSAVLISYYANM
jgi:hypothetical protein